MSERIYKGEAGIKIKVRVIAASSSSDLSSASNFTLEVRKPNQKEVTFIGASENDSDGNLKLVTYTLAIVDINQSGTYDLHAEFDEGGFPFIGNKASFRVFDKFQGPEN